MAMSNHFTKAAGVIPYLLFNFWTELIIVENLILQASYRFTVRESAPVNYQVATIRARDEDSFSFGPISFALGGGLDRDDFKLNQPVSFVFFFSFFLPFCLYFLLFQLPSWFSFVLFHRLWNMVLYVTALNQTLLMIFKVGIGFYLWFDDFDFQPDTTDWELCTENESIN